MLCWVFRSGSSLGVCTLSTNSFQNVHREFIERVQRVTASKTFYVMTFTKGTSVRETLLELLRTLFKLHSFSPGESEVVRTFNVDGTMNRSACVTAGFTLDTLSGLDIFTCLFGRWDGTAWQTTRSGGSKEPVKATRHLGPSVISIFREYESPEYSWIVHLRLCREISRANKRRK